MKTHVSVQLVEAIWRCCNGREAKAAPGMTRYAEHLVLAVGRCCNGPESKAVPSSTETSV